MTDLTAPHFHDADKARDYLESVRWPDGAFCPHCGGTERCYPLKGVAHRPGLYKCGDCRKQFTVTVGTLFERSKVPLHKWLMATQLLCSSKKGISSHQLHRMLDVSYKTAWFMSHRIREAMREKNPEKLGGDGGSGVIESDEVYIGGKQRRPHGIPAAAERSKDGKKRSKRWGSYGQDKEKVISLVERGGRVRSQHVANVNVRNLRPFIWGHVDKRATLMTDEAAHYKSIGRGFKAHHTVNHSMGEYVRGDAYTNTIEGYFSILKRGINGVYQHVSAEHLKRYLGEFDFRYNHREITDGERAIEALRGIEGKRLTYHQAGSQAPTAG